MQSYKLGPVPSQEIVIPSHPRAPWCSLWNTVTWISATWVKRHQEEEVMRPTLCRLAMGSLFSDSRLISDFAIFACQPHPCDTHVTPMWSSFAELNISDSKRQSAQVRCGTSSWECNRPGLANDGMKIAWHTSRPWNSMVKHGKTRCFFSTRSIKSVKWLQDSDW